MHQPIELRAFRGTRRSSTYRSHLIVGAVAARLAVAAADGGFPALAAVVRGDEADLDKPLARRVADEATSLRATAAVLEFDSELVALAEVANWCARARGRAWLQVKPLE